MNAQLLWQLAEAKAAALKTIAGLQSGVGYTTEDALEDLEVLLKQLDELYTSVRR